VAAKGSLMARNQCPSDSLGSRCAFVPLFPSSPTRCCAPRMLCLEVPTTEFQGAS